MADTPQRLLYDAGNTEGFYVLMLPPGVDKPTLYAVSPEYAYSGWFATLTPGTAKWVYNPFFSGIQESPLSKSPSGLPVSGLDYSIMAVLATGNGPGKPEPSRVGIFSVMGPAGSPMKQPYGAFTSRLRSGTLNIQ